MSSPGGRRDQRKQETREGIRDAAHALFAERGFARTTVDHIADAAHVSRRTFFRYFASKDDLLRTDIADILPLMLANLASRPAQEVPLIAILESLKALVNEGSVRFGVAESMAGPVSGVRARIGLLRILSEWERGITECLLRRTGTEPGEASEDQYLRAVVTASAATSALRSSIQIYRSRASTSHIELTEIVEKSFITLSQGCVPPD